MFYDFALVVPASTTSAAGYTEELQLEYGVIKNVDVFFPRGCCGLVTLGLERYTRQIIPSNNQGKLRADGENIQANYEYELYDKPFMLTARAWNLDERYSHTLQIRITMEHKTSSLVVTNASEELMKMLGV